MLGMRRASAVLYGVSSVGLLAVLVCGCNRIQATNAAAPVPPAGSSAPASTENPSAATVSSPLFVEVSKAAGLDYRWKAPGKRPLNILETIGNGGAFLDYDEDGNLDILLVGPKLALYKGDGTGRFADVTAPTGLDKLQGYFLGCGTGDYDNDGYTDLYITAYRGGLLLHNEGGKRFRDVTREAGIPPQPWGTSCAFADIDKDGKLDLFICNYVIFGPDTKPQLCKYSGLMSACGPRFYKPEFGALYRNLGGGKFQDITRAWLAHGDQDSRKSNVSGKALGIAIADFDGSGRESIALANDEVPGDLLHNLGGKFKNVGATSGTAYDNDGNVHGGMGIDWGDYDNDGLLDLVVATFQHEVKNVYRNEGGGIFTDNAAMLGLADKTKPYVSFGVKWFDYDNDGWLDLIFASGHVQDNIADIDKSTTFKQPTLLFRNEGGQSFSDMTAQGGETLQIPIMGRGLAVGDYDNDGRVDVLLIDSDGPVLLLHNESGGPKNQNSAPHHWLSCKLVGTKSNRQGIGAMVTVEAGGRKRTRRCATDGSYMSASDRRVHFGLGSATTIDRVTVAWPSGRKDTYQNVPIDQVVTLTEGSTVVKTRTLARN